MFYISWDGKFLWGKLEQFKDLPKLSTNYMRYAGVQQSCQCSRLYKHLFRVRRRYFVRACLHLEFRDFGQCKNGIIKIKIT